MDGSFDNSTLNDSITFDTPPNNKLARLEDQRNTWKQSYDDVNKEASMYKQMANYYRKEAKKKY